MNPVAIFRHYPTEGPGYFATFLDRRKIPWRLIPLDQGEAVPAAAASFSGMVFMGGPMSVNDDLRWIPKVLSLIRRAVDEEIPVLGHCLGGQLMAKALGGVVAANPVREIGWGEVTVAAVGAARAWLPGIEKFQSFHWHGETFSIPGGATRILSSPWCANQAFVLGRHLAMQCHVEMTEEMVKTWCQTGRAEIARNPSPSVQSVEQIESGLASRIPALNRVADALYGRWIEGLAPAGGAQSR